MGTKPARDLSRALGRTQDLAWFQENIDITEVVNHKVGTTLVNNTDARADWNALHYHHPDTGKWSIFPWDLDLTWESKNHWRAESVWENFQKVFRHDAAETELNNRAREAHDLLVASGEGAKVFEEFTRMITTGEDDKIDFVHANHAMWDYHRRTTKKGIWYKNNPRLPSAERNWDGLLNYYKTFVSDDTTYAVDRLIDKADTNDPVPDKPTISYLGADGFPIDGLTFETSAYAATDKATDFAGMQWRIAEITDPDAEGLRPDATLDLRDHTRLGIGCARGVREFDQSAFRCAATGAHVSCSGSTLGCVRSVQPLVATGRIYRRDARCLRLHRQSVGHRSDVPASGADGGGTRGRTPP